MSQTYRAIDWNPQKRRYDRTLALVLVVTAAVFASVSGFVAPDLTIETILIRTSSVSALLLLHVILAIGPLARFDPRFLPLLYNRRHLGVTLFFLGLFHAVFATIQFHALGNENPIVGLFTAYASDYRILDDGRWVVRHVPFEPFGAVALVVFFLMAATSHDFWLRNLGAPLWKALHLGVYLAYGSVLVHVALGALQSEPNPIHVVLLSLGFVGLAALHLAAARKETRLDAAIAGATNDGFVDVGPVSLFVEGRGRVVRAGSERMAIYRHEGGLFAVSNVCRHQGGPLGEGRIVDGCITCPWHGWNYRPEDGCSPPPFDERIPTYPVRIVDDRVLVKPSS